MSDADAANKRVSQLAPTGSKRWFWQMRLMNSPLFIAPCITVFAALNAWEVEGVKDPSLPARLVHTIPWVLAGATVVVLAHALWRIIVNLATKHPFTEKDKQVFNRALTVQIGLGLAIVLGGFIGVPTIMLITGTDDSGIHYGDALYGPLVLSTVVSMLTHAINVMYARARTYYEELEKGV